jgi:hypothetical protein
MRDKDQMFDVEMYINDLSNLIIDFMVTYYDTPRWIRVAGKNPNEYSFEPFIGSDYKDLEYDIFIDISSKAPMTRLKEAQDAKELMNMQGQYQFNPPVMTPQRLMKMGNYSNADQIIEEMNAEEMKAKGDLLDKILQTSFDSLAQGHTHQEVLQMAQQQLQEMEQKSGMGSTSNSNNVQMRQGGTPQ